MQKKEGTASEVVPLASCVAGVASHRQDVLGACCIPVHLAMEVMTTTLVASAGTGAKLLEFAPVANLALARGDDCHGTTTLAAQDRKIAVVGDHSHMNTTTLACGLSLLLEELLVLVGVVCTVLSCTRSLHCCPLTVPCIP